MGTIVAPALWLENEFKNMNIIHTYLQANIYRNIMVLFYKSRMAKCWSVENKLCTQSVWHYLIPENFIVTKYFLVFFPFLKLSTPCKERQFV